MRVRERADSRRRYVRAEPARITPAERLSEITDSIEHIVSEICGSNRMLLTDQVSALRALKFEMDGRRG